MKMNRYFQREEFACLCGCGFAAVDYELLELLSVIRTTLEEPVIINSACRCEEHNERVGGAKGSYHKKGMAADIRCNTATPERIYDLVTSLAPDDSWGAIKYQNFVHVDVRDKAYRKG